MTLDYDDRGQLETVTDAKDQVTSYRYTGQGQLARTTADDASHTDLQYDATGNLSERIDANAHTTTFGYDDAGQRISTSTQEGSLWTYGYDPAGNLEHVTDANGNATSRMGDGTTAYGYDELNRLKTIDYSDATPDVGLGYDRDNNRTSMTDAAGTQTYGYDELDRLHADHPRHGDLRLRVRPIRQRHQAHLPSASRDRLSLRRRRQPPRGRASVEDHDL